MVTFLDLGLLEHFSYLFPILFVFIVVFAVLENFKILGENKGIHSLIALLLSSMLLFSKTSLGIISILTPWFVVAVIFLMFVFLLFMMFGLEQKDIAKVVKEDKLLYWIVITISIFMLFAAIGKTFFASSTSTDGGIGQAFVSTTGNVGEGAFWLTLFHPKVLGVVFVFLIAMFAVRMLSGNIVPKE